jgi:ATP-dependent DNA helicase RecG
MFDTKEELLEKIRLGEDSVLELKAVRFKGARIEGPSRNDLADELSAFANSGDGVLLLGVDDKTREIEGIPIGKLDLVEDQVREVCNDSITPPLRVRVLRMEMPDSGGTPQPIIKVDIPRSLFVHKSPGGYLERRGSSKREMPPDLLARLFQQRSQARIIRFDEQAVPETGLQNLREDLWRRFVSEVDETEEITLGKRGLLTRDETGELRASVAGVLMCSPDPAKLITGAYIEAVSYRGRRQDSNYQLDAKRITGPLDEQIRQATQFVQRNQRVSAAKTPHRVERPQYSERAVFEAVVNAVAHRDYSIHGSKIRLFLFTDRLELYSPGPLPNTVTIETLPLRQATRNELTTTLLAECPVGDLSSSVGRTAFMEKRGDGVPIIIRESERASGRSPVYRLIDDAELLLTIFAADDAEGGQEDENREGT